jgi:Flp pilus assembly protein TadD
LGYYFLAQTYARMKRFNEADLLFDQALRYEPRSVRILKAKAIAYFEARRFEEAENLLQLLHIQGEENPDLEVLFYQGKIFQAKGVLDQALARFLKVVESNPIDARPLASLGECYLQLNFKYALELFNQALRLDKNLDFCYIQCAIIFSLFMRETDFIETIVAELRSFSSETSTYQGLLIDLGGRFYEVGRILKEDPPEAWESFYQEVQEVFTPAYTSQNESRYVNLSVPPGHLPSSEKIKKLSQRMKEIYQKKALENFEKGLALNPHSVSAYTNRGGFYNQIGELDKARKDLLQAIQIGGDLHLAYYNLACNYALSKEPQKALEMLEQALQKGFSSVHALEQDKELDSLKALPAFQLLQEKLRQIPQPTPYESLNSSSLFALAHFALQSQSIEKACSDILFAFLQGFDNLEVFENEFAKTPLKSYPEFQAFEHYLISLSFLKSQNLPSALLTLEEMMTLVFKPGSLLPKKNILRLLQQEKLSPLHPEPQFQQWLKQLQSL